MFWQRIMDPLLSFWKHIAEQLSPTLNGGQVAARLETSCDVDTACLHALGAFGHVHLKPMKVEPFALWVLRHGHYAQLPSSSSTIASPDTVSGKRIVVTKSGKHLVEVSFAGIYFRSLVDSTDVRKIDYCDLRGRYVRYGIAVDSLSRLWLSCFFTEQEIWGVIEEGRILHTLKLPFVPSVFAFLPNGQLVIARNNIIGSGAGLVFCDPDMSGEEPMDTVTSPHLPKWIHCMKVSRDEIFVLGDCNTNRISVFSLTGQFLRFICQGRLSLPQSIEVTYDGHVLVCERRLPYKGFDGKFCVSVWTVQGIFVRYWHFNFGAANDIAVLPYGKVAVTGSSGQIVIFGF